MLKLSIIVPAYNAARDIERCLDSLLDQDFNDDYEIIVVNDGSKDNTAVILDGYQKRYPGVFHIITKENGGLPSARNAGMDAARGQWICFCDSDDYIKKNALSYVVNNFVDDSIDICTFYTVTLDAIALKTFKDTEEVIGKIIYEGTTVERYAKANPSFVVNNVYRNDAIRDIRFRPATMCEDMIFNLEVYMKDLRIRCTDTKVYYYTVSDGQLTRKRDPKTMRAAMSSYEMLFDLAKRFQKEKNDDSLSRGLDFMISFQFQPFLSRMMSANLSVKEFSETMARLKRKGIFPTSANSTRWRVINTALRLPWLYPIESFLYRKVFVPYVLPRLSRNN